MFDVSLATQMVHQTKSNWKKKTEDSPSTEDIKGQTKFKM